MDFSPGVAAALYDQGQHPRLFLGPDDLPVLRRRIRRGRARALAELLRLRTAPLVDRVLASDDLPTMLANWCKTWHEPGTKVVEGMHDMALVAALDEDPRYLDALRAIFRAAPAADQPQSQPRKSFGISAGMSLALAFDLIHEHLAPELRRHYIDWVVPRGIRLAIEMAGPNYMRHAGGNIGIFQMKSGFYTALVLHREPGVGDLSEELRFFIRCLEASLYSAIGEDGYPEEDIGYGPGTVARLLELGEATRRAGLYDPWTGCPRSLRFGRAMLHFVQPWGGALSNTGDHGDDFGQREFVLPRLASLTADPELIWLTTNLSYSHGRVHPENEDRLYERELQLAPGKQVPATAWSLYVEPGQRRGRPPSQRTPTSFRDRTRGIVSFRSGWDADATFVVFDGSQRTLAAQGHAHASGGHFSLSALGEYFSIDTGRYNNEQDCHSVVLIDGKSGRSTNRQWTAVKHAAVLTDYAPGPLVDTASVDSTLQHNCYRAKRQLFLIKGACPYVVVVDDLNARDDWAEYHWQLQTSPENTITIKPHSAAIKGWRHGNWLDVHMAIPAASEYPKSHAVRFTQDVGMISSRDYFSDLDEKVAAYPRPADMLHGPVFKRPRLLAIVEGYNGRFLSALIPRRRGAKAARYKQLPAIPGTLAIQVTHTDCVDTFIYSYENHLLEADDIVGRGRWCFVRRDSAGTVIDYAADADRLQVSERLLTIY